MARGQTSYGAAPLIANPWPAPKDHQPKNTLCDLCDRSIKTKDWAAHKNSKKHREAEEKAEALEKRAKVTTDAEIRAFDFDPASPMSPASGWGSNSFGETASRNTVGGGRDDRECFGCGEIGHVKRDCPQSGARACFSCGEFGHKKVDCPNPSNNGGGRGAGHLCYNCNQPGHNKAECPEPLQGGGGGGGFACHNCGETGHRKSECPHPHVMKCRNCDELGHVSRDCPKPKDWSRVQCNNCKEMGHTVKRCPFPFAEEEDGVGGDWSNDAAMATPAVSGWDDGAVATDDNWGGNTDGEANW